MALEQPVNKSERIWGVNISVKLEEINLILDHHESTDFVIHGEVETFN